MKLTISQIEIKMYLNLRMKACWMLNYSFKNHKLCLSLTAQLLWLRVLSIASPSKDQLRVRRIPVVVKTGQINKHGLVGCQWWLWCHWRIFPIQKTSRVSICGYVWFSVCVRMCKFGLFTSMWEKHNQHQISQKPLPTSKAVKHKAHLQRPLPMRWALTLNL